MTYTATQLEVIKTFWRKELSKWLIIWKERISEIIAIDYEREWFYIMIDDWENTFSWSIKWAEILWHIPHLEDVFRMVEKKRWVMRTWFPDNVLYWFFPKIEETFRITYNPTIQLLEQPESVLIELLNLFK